MPITLSELWIFPVKGCRGVHLRVARLLRSGLAGDREWMIVDADGQFVSQRTRPRLALVVPRLGPGRLVLAAPGSGEVVVDVSDLEPRPPVTVWDDAVAAVSAGGEARRWLREVLGTPCDLVRMAPGARRLVDPRYAAPEDQVSFADAFPVLLISRGSLDELNRRLEPPVPMDRFRPNLVVQGCPPFAEDGWSRIAVGETALRVAKPCARCAVTTVDQATGERGREPLATLATFRTRGGKVLFGQNLVPEELGTLRVGDRVAPQPSSGKGRRSQQ